MQQSEITDLQDFLQVTTFFHHLTEKETELIPLHENLEKYKRNTIIYQEDDRINGFYIVYSGIIKIYKTGVDGKDQIIRFAKRGDIMGFRSTITGEKACTTAKVIENAEVIYVDGDLVKQFVKSNGDFAMDLLRIACRELGEANDYITDIAQKTVRERLAEVLIQLKISFDIAPDKYLNILLTREEIASMVGTATESVIRLLTEFKHDNLIEVNGRRIKILNEEKLKTIANFS